ncbi:MAG: DUF2238 domain-containing protein [Phycisphaerales bacterium]
MRRARIPIYVLVAVYMPAFSLLALTQGNQEFLFYALAMLVIIVGIWLLDRRVHFSTGVLWLLAVWGLVHMAGGTVPPPTGDARVLYSWRPFPEFLKYDQVVHAYGFFAATFACAECLRAAFPREKPVRISFGLGIGLMLMGMGLGALNEVIEFTATRLFANTNVGGYDNTGWDLVSNLVGAASAAALLVIRDKASPTPRDDDPPPAA